MSTQLGADYSPYVQPLITLAQAQAFKAAGIDRMCVALDIADVTLNSCRNLAAAGIDLDGYRELSGPATYATQTQGALAAFSILSAEKIYFRRLWLTAEDTSVGVRPDILVPAMHNAVNAASGFAVGIYTGAWYWPTYMGNATDFSNLPLWHASYDGHAALGQVNYGGWTQMDAKQYNSPVTVAGVPLDVDIWNVTDPVPLPQVNIPDAIAKMKLALLDLGAS